MSTQHTRGPWHWVGDKFIDGPNGESVLECGDDGRDWGMHSAVLTINDADRALLVAAPELLAELRTTTMYLQSACLIVTDPEARRLAMERVSAARAVIAKVEGK